MGTVAQIKRNKLRNGSPPQGEPNEAQPGVIRHLHGVQGANLGTFEGRGDAGVYLQPGDMGKQKIIEVMAKMAVDIFFK